MKKGNNTILIILVVILSLGNLFFGYMFFFHKNVPNRQGFANMQITDAQKQEVTSFFDSTTDTTQIANYCNQNRIECFYYCRTINPTNSYCSQLMQNRTNFQPSQ
jgi:hypothetical protein